MIFIDMWGIYESAIKIIKKKKKSRTWWQNELMVELHMFKKKIPSAYAIIVDIKVPFVGEAISWHVTQVTVQELYAALYNFDTPVCYLES